MRKLKNSLSWRNGLLLSSIGLLLVLSFFPNLRAQILKVIKVKKTSKLDEYPANTLIQKYAKDAGLDRDRAKMLAAKAFVETGWFASPVYNEGHNAFGMRCPRIRPNLMQKCSYTNSKYGYSIFSNLKDSVNDYLLWWKYHKIGVGAINHWSLRQLLQEEKDHAYYTTDVDSYYKKVKWFYDKL